MNNKYIWFTTVIVLFLVFITFVIYSFDYCIAWNMEIDHDATLSFVEILGVILTPAAFYVNMQEKRKFFCLIFSFFYFAI